MGIKSLDELKRIREQCRAKTGLRHTGDYLGESGGEYIEILVGMATCGIAAGARETMSEIISELSKSNIDNVRVIPVGCIGFCAEEPVIQVNIPDNDPVVYGNIKRENVKEIIESHIINKKPVENKIIHVEFNRI